MAKGIVGATQKKKKRTTTTMGNQDESEDEDAPSPPLKPWLNGGQRGLNLRAREKAQEWVPVSSLRAKELDG
jgi:hypothetical protein